jgi:cyclase
MRPISDGVFAWLTPNGNWGESNTALIAGHGSSLLVDTLWDLPRTQAMLAGFRPMLENAPIRQVVNTHSDGDHWFGNCLTGAAEIIATKTASRRMTKHAPREMRSLGGVCRVFRLLSHAPVPHRQDWLTAAEYLEGMLRPFHFADVRAVPPNFTFSGKFAVNVGGRDVQLVELGPAHTAGDLVVYVPDERVLIAGDILFLGTTPILWDGSARNWIRACEQILTWKVDTVVPGHGPVTDLSGVDAVRQYWQFLRTAARRHFDRGRPAYQAAVKIVFSDEFRAQPFASWDCPERIVVNVHSLYRRMLGQRHRMGTFERLMVLRKTAVLAREMG